MNEGFMEVTKEESKVGLWLKLESLYMAKSFTNQFLLKSRSDNIWFEEGNYLKSHLDQFYSIIMDIQNINVT